MPRPMTDRNRVALAVVQVMQAITEAVASNGDVDEIWQAVRGLFAELDDDTLAGLAGFFEDHMPADMEPADQWIRQGALQALRAELDVRAAAREGE